MLLVLHSIALRSADGVTLDLPMTLQWPDNCDASTWQVVLTRYITNLFTAIFTVGRERKDRITIQIISAGTKDDGALYIYLTRVWYMVILGIWYI